MDLYKERAARRSLLKMLSLITIIKRSPVKAATKLFPRPTPPEPSDTLPSPEYWCPDLWSADIQKPPVSPCSH